MAQAAPYDAIVLDMMLPDLDGLEVVRRLRAKQVWTPVLMLTARDAVADRVGALDSGVDDYLTKPFSFAELFARLRAIVRRDRSSGQRFSRPATCVSIRRRTVLGGASTSSTCRRESLRCSSS